MITAGRSGAVAAKVPGEHGGKVPAGTVAPWSTTRPRGSRRWSRRQDRPLPLDEALLLIAAHADPTLDVDARAAPARRARGRGSTEPTVDGAAPHLCSATSGFAGDRDTYHDRRQLAPPRRARPPARASRSAWPCSPSRSAGAAASRWRASACRATTSSGRPASRDRFLDVFDGGRELDVEGCRRLLRAGAAGGAVGRCATSGPTSPAAIVARVARQPGRRLPPGGRSRRACAGRSSCASLLPSGTRPGAARAGRAARRVGPLRRGRRRAGGLGTEDRTHEAAPRLRAARPSVARSTALVAGACGASG